MFYCYEPLLLYSIIIHSTPWSNKTIIHQSGKPSKITVGGIPLPIDLSGRSPQLWVFTCEILWGDLTIPNILKTWNIMKSPQLEFFQVFLNDFLPQHFDQFRVRWGRYNLYLYTSPWNPRHRRPPNRLKWFCQSSGDMMASPLSTTAWYPSMTLPSKVCPVFVPSYVSSPKVMDRTITCSNLKLSLSWFVVGMCCIMNPCWNR